MNPDFGTILEAYGHSCVWIAERDEWRGEPDWSHLDRLSEAEADVYLTLDWNREPDVWAAVYGRLADGIGRLLRIKIKPGEVPDIPTLTRYWAVPYDRVEGWLNEPEWKLIQVGLQITQARREPGGARAYAVQHIATMVQQQMGLHGDALVRRGTPRANVPRGRGRPRKK